jgi:hypothetical protein
VIENKINVEGKRSIAKGLWWRFLNFCSYGFYIGATESCWVAVGTATGLCEENHYTVYKPYESEFFTTTLITRLYVRVIYNIRTLLVNIQFICTSFRNRQISEPSASFSCLLRSEYKWILYLPTMYVMCLSVVKGVFFVVRVTLVPVSYLSAPFAVHSYRVPGKFIRRLKSLFVGWKVYS